MDLSPYFKESRFVVALQESLIALAPFAILTSFLTLLAQLPFYVHWAFPPNLFQTLDFLSKGMQQLMSIATVVSVAYHFAVRYDAERMLAMLLGLAVFLSTLVLSASRASALLVLPFSLDIWQIVIPVASVFLLKALSPYLAIPLDEEKCSTYACRVLRHLYTFALSYSLLLGVWLGLNKPITVFTEYSHRLLAFLPAHLLVEVRTFLVQSFWFIGIQGNRIANALMGPALLQREIFPNLSLVEFYRLFASAGGTGMGIALIIALYLNHKDRHGLRIAQISTPFVVFNINTFVIYCFPVVLNRFLLIPFFVVPLVNALIAYVFLSIFPTTFYTARVHWTMPVFVNAWIVGKGNVWLLVLQAFLIAVGVAIYFPFVKRFSATRSFDYHLKNLYLNLGLPESLHVHQGLSLHKAQHEIIEANLRLNDIIHLLSTKTLLVYYQPKIDVRNQRCVGFEALLRVRLSDGTVTGPFFLQDIENAGLSPTIDLWVAREVKRHLRAWRATGFTPHISINLHPDTINSVEAVRQLVSLLQGEPIEFEIIERSFLGSSDITHNLEMLKQQGFRIAIDDFGRGYSSYRFLSEVNVDTVKTDKSLIPLLEHAKGVMIWEHMINLCHRLHLTTIAEGVETEAQARRLTQMGIDIIQGYYFSKAIPMQLVPQYVPLSNQTVDAQATTQEPD